MNLHDFHRWADTVRSIPLETVLAWWGADRDWHDKSQWRTDRGPLSVTRNKFFSWHHEVGGGGAIDLVIHLSGWPAGQAIGWLARQTGRDCVTEALTCAAVPRELSSTSSVVSASPRSLRLPAALHANLPRVRRYLTEQRRLTPQIVQTLIDTGKLYADERGNAVFLMVAGKANRAIGAELRGTGRHAWRGLAPGSSKDAGYFWIGIASPAQQIVLCESAIDAISCFQRDASRICISTAGVRPDPSWLKRLIARGYEIACGFDDDRPGNETAGKMISLHPTIQRLRPPAHDWNDALADGK